MMSRNRREGHYTGADGRQHLRSHYGRRVSAAAARTERKRRNYAAYGLILQTSR